MHSLYVETGWSIKTVIHYVIIMFEIDWALGWRGRDGERTWGGGSRSVGLGSGNE